MANIKIFNNELFGDIRVITKDDEAWFVGKDIAEALGYKNTSDALNKHVDEDDKVQIAKRDLQNCDDIGTKGTTLINESGLYSLVFGSNKQEAKVFKKWVTSEVLPTIRKSGCYITESATQEVIDFQSKFGTRRIRKTFREATDIEATWNEYKALSKIERDAHRIDNKDRLKACDIIVDELSDYIANNTASMKASKIILYKEIIEDILNQKITWSNKMYGGKISNQNRRIKELEQKIDELTPPERDYIILNYSGFSENYMYSNGHKSCAYVSWINRFPVWELPTKEDFEEQGIDFTKPIGIHIQYVCKRKMDHTNLNKAFLDQLFNRYLGVDDNIVKCEQSEVIGYCDNFKDGKIIFAIYNL